MTAIRDSTKVRCTEAESSHPSQPGFESWTVTLCCMPSHFLSSSLDSRQLVSGKIYGKNCADSRFICNGRYISFKHSLKLLQLSYLSQMEMIYESVGCCNGSKIHRHDVDDRAIEGLAVEQIVTDKCNLLFFFDLHLSSYSKDNLDANEVHSLKLCVHTHRRTHRCTHTNTKICIGNIHLHYCPVISLLYSHSVAPVSLFPPMNVKLSEY